jgi:aryl-alcohol dehydrogenase-like predicted oxidoreductase
VKLVLGTVQFGLIYGVATNGARPSDAEIRDTLALAHRYGIRSLDTAPLYGDIESRLETLCAGLPFSIVSKIPPVPDDLVSGDVSAWALQSANLTLDRLGENLTGLLFHRAEDLVREGGADLWQSVVNWARSKNVSVGVSGSGPEEVRSLSHIREISILQLPGNAFDQRLRTLAKSANSAPLLQLRSAFLQGLLLLPLEVAAARLPAALAPLRRWHTWLQDHSLSALQGALSIVKGFENTHSCVIGVDNASQLEEILDVWDQVHPIRADELAILDTRVIDPRSWEASE